MATIRDITSNRGSGNAISLQFDGAPVLRGPASVTTKRGDFSAQYHHMAQAVFDAFRHVNQVKLAKAYDDKGFIADRFTITVVQPLDAPTKLNAHEVMKIVTPLLAAGRAFDENGFLRALNDFKPPANTASLSQHAKGFISGPLVKAIQEKNPDHVVGVEFIKFIPTDMPGVVDVGVALDNDCTTCQISAATTLNFAALALRDKFFASADVQKISGGTQMRNLVVIPRSNGSPYMTVTPRAHTLGMPN